MDDSNSGTQPMNGAEGAMQLLNVLNANLDGSSTQPLPTADDDGNAAAKSVKTGGALSLAERFDPKRLRISQSFGETAGTKKVVTVVQVTKPNQQACFRVHPDPAYRENLAVIVLRESRRVYLVEPGLMGELRDEITCVTMFTAITRDGGVFLWPVKLPDPDGRPNSWSDSEREAAAQAMTNWARITANMSAGSYQCRVAPGDLAEPQWPDLTFVELLSIGFKGDRFIQTLDHPLVAKLRGVR